MLPPKSPFSIGCEPSGQTTEATALGKKSGGASWCNLTSKGSALAASIVSRLCCVLGVEGRLLISPRYADQLASPLVAGSGQGGHPRAPWLSLWGVFVDVLPGLFVYDLGMLLSMRFWVFTVLGGGGGGGHSPSGRGPSCR